MKILVCSGAGDGAWMVWKLQHDGHDVQWCVDDDKYRDLLAGLIPPPVDSITHPADYELIVFDCCCDGAIADGLREHTPVIGSSSFAEKLELDRKFGIEFMEKCGIPVPPWQEFSDVADAIHFIKEKKKRYVFKPSGDVADKATTYVSKSAEDMVKYLEILFKRTRISDFILQEVIEGTEVSTDGWFNGTEFCYFGHTLEEKKFMAGGIGPNTGCSGNLVWMPTRPDTLFERGLRRATEALRGTGFVGPIDLNTIVTEGELYGLEWTPRFGYEGTCNTIRLIPSDFGEFMYTIATGGTPAPVAPTYPFSATVRVTIPPYPSEAKPKKHGGIPINGIDPDKLDAWYVMDLRVKEGMEGELETVGVSGLVGAPIGCGESPEQAFFECQKAIDQTQIPDAQYRKDVAKCCGRRYQELLKNGWLRSI